MTRAKKCRIRKKVGIILIHFSEDKIGNLQRREMIAHSILMNIYLRIVITVLNVFIQVVNLITTCH